MQNSVRKIFPLATAFLLALCSASTAGDNAGVVVSLDGDTEISGVGAGATIDNALDIGSIIKMDATSGIITATTFKGVGEVLGIGSEGTPIGSGVSFIDFRSSTGTAFSCQPAVNGIATVTVTPGVSLGLAIALGG